jgi:hypothetical protein
MKYEVEDFHFWINFSFPNFPYLFFLQEFPKLKVLRELSILKPEKELFNQVKGKECKRILKTNEKWEIRDCKGGIYFTLFFKKDGNFSFGYCFDSQSKREIYLKVQEFFPDFPCIDLKKEDAEITPESLKRIGLKVYDLCGGRQVLFKGNCVIGVK